ncbi:tRNA lysidine(34) synthetase TilS [Pseudoalteromonas sp. G4]|uniref:tRNA lysidine(34) synthetase TilS n=1 Tax=Pseudoalteromonas sp. G4 TaxID=2992761 RepID=UPI00237DB3DA|nr:tRNA lysidine(34) synthetase TilS [Pseudoalteromonas sp. G4]MDE3272402.1 tRNA lysidine(34) synthetase TilS [Pseudoalteromonas sp. G4]
MYQTFKHYLLENKFTKFTVALSGGVDSVVLLHLAKRFRDELGTIELKAVHVNHGLSDNAPDWQKFCQTLCQSWQIPFEASEVSLNLSPRQSLEAIARDARYQAIKHSMLADSCLLVGQHIDDQVETFFIRLKRGAGLLGLGAMARESTNDFGLFIVRPLLDFTRNEIEQYATDHALSHITDESNTDDRFDRNFLRNQVLPLLNGRFQGFNRTVLRVTQLLQSQQQLLDEYIAEDAKLCVQGNKICFENLHSFSRTRIENLIRFWLKNQHLQLPSQKILNQIVEQGLNAKADAQVQIHCGDFFVCRYQSALYVVFPKASAVKEAINISLDEIDTAGRKYKRVQSHHGIRLPYENESVSLRFNIGSEQFTLKKRNCTKSVNTWLKEEKVPPWLRPYVAGVFYNDKLVQVIGLGVDKHAYAQNGVLWIEKEQNEN